ncbi:hypothetical protein SLEP1_g27565 [Rubroshorea leprosula]|uniref:Uncharacterized protein n=1 Tax=Rubroshorea leprosula TaxID=152421 RepID=A0AAV5K3F8_9ROSI|nr:hypothetical protein SLEP1_g27565 [Rubroshorea leprosula]
MDGRFWFPALSRPREDCKYCLQQGKEVQQERSKEKDE